MMRQIRISKSEDTVQIFNLYRAESWQSFSMKVVESLLEKSDYLVIEENGEIIGFVRYLTDNILTTFIAELVIKSDCRKQGFGTQLIDVVQKRHPHTRLELISEADTFYEAIGFRKVGTGYRRTK